MNTSAYRLTPDELLTTTRSVRRRLDLDRPVEHDVLTECLELALQAPSGSNRQAWHWVFVTDPAQKEALAELYRECFTAAYGPDVVPEMTQTEQRMWLSARYLADNFSRAPVILIPCQWGRPDTESVPGQAAYWGSLLPAVWSFMLALRSRGLGSAWTTLHLHRERDAAELLGIPYARCAQAAMIPIAYTKGLEFRPGPRKPSAEIVHWDRW
ncbi:MAG TPA: nitroreductase family protein [Streptosporangiaceae bacterium]|nr:nitroreductase family protein [Streptosporangiaceae bacterium]